MTELSRTIPRHDMSRPTQELGLEVIRNLSDPARAAAESLLAESLRDRWSHVQRVAATAGELADAVGLSQAERDLAVASAWLHDVGYAPALLRSLDSRCLGPTGFHPLDGAVYLYAEGWPDDLVGLVAHHSLADVEALHRGLEPELVQYPDRPGLVRDVLWVADLTSGPRGQGLTVDERLTDVVLRYGRDHLVSECMVVVAAAAARRLHGRADAGGRRSVALSVAMGAWLVADPASLAANPAAGRPSR